MISRFFFRIIKFFERCLDTEGFRDKIRWGKCNVWYLKPSEKFIEKCLLNNIDFDWYFVSKWEKLSERFIRKFQDKFYWPDIVEYQKLDKKFKNGFGSDDLGDESKCFCFGF